MKNLIRQLFFITFGFFIGQGSFFLLLSDLYINQNFQDITNLSIGVGFFSLFIWLSDGAGTVFISSLIKDGVFENKFSTYLLARLCSVLFYWGVAVVAFYIFEALNDVVFYFLLISIFPAIFNAFNVQSTFDYTGETKLVGLFASLSFFLFSISFYILEGSFYRYQISCAMFIIGVLINVCIQHALIKFNYELLKFDFCFFRECLLSIMKFNLVYSSAQVYPRVILLMVDHFFGQSISANFAYAKSIMNVANQFVAFSRRLEFKKLLDISGPVDLCFYMKLLKSQFVSLLFTIIVLLSTFCIFLFDDFFSYDGKANDLVNLSTALAVSSFFWFFSSAIFQFILARKLLTFYSVTNIFSVLLSIGFSYFLLIQTNSEIYYVILAEVLMYILQIAMAVIYLNKKSKSL